MKNSAKDFLLLKNRPTGKLLALHCSGTDENETLLPVCGCSLCIYNSDHIH